MDFISDLENIAKEVLDSYDVDYSGTKSNRDIVRMFVNIQLKMIKARPMKVIKSNKVLQGTFSNTIKDALADIEKKFRDGEDINPHLSKYIFNGTFTDLLLSDWGIYHLHLNTMVEGKYFIKRSKDVLFIKIEEDTVYFIDIRPHGPSGDKYVFAQKELLKIIRDEWPDILDKYRMNDVVDLEYVVDDPAQIDKLRKAGINVLQKVNDAVYSSIGGGITTAGTSLDVTIQTDYLYRMARKAEEYVQGKREEIIQQIMQNTEFLNTNPIYKLKLDNKGFYIGDESTGFIIGRL